jgi:MFS family permease
LHALVALQIWHELIVSGTIGAAAVFALIAGAVGDGLGRKKTIMIASVIFAAGAIVMAVAPSKEVLLAGRIIVGVSIGNIHCSLHLYHVGIGSGDLAEWLERCASIPKITGWNPSSSSEFSFRSDLLLTARGGST